VCGNVDTVPFATQKFVSQRDLILSATVDRLFASKRSDTLESSEGPDSACKEALGRRSVQLGLESRVFSGSAQDSCASCSPT